MIFIHLASYTGRYQERTAQSGNEGPVAGKQLRSSYNPVACTYSLKFEVILILKVGLQ